MAKMTPEQEAAYALDFGADRSGLGPEAQLAYDRLVEQRARARTQAPVSQTRAEATSGPSPCHGGLPPWAPRSSP